MNPKHNTKKKCCPECKGFCTGNKDGVPDCPCHSKEQQSDKGDTICRDHQTCKADFNDGGTEERTRILQMIDGMKFIILPVKGKTSTEIVEDTKRIEKEIGFNTALETLKATIIDSSKEVT